MAVDGNKFFVLSSCAYLQDIPALQRHICVFVSLHFDLLLKNRINDRWKTLYSASYDWEDFASIIFLSHQLIQGCGEIHLCLKVKDHLYSFENRR